MENYTEIIEQFINNELEGDKLQWFQDQLRTNKDFVNQYKLHIDINEAIKEDNIMKLRAKLDEIYNDVVLSEKKKTRFIRIKQFSVAASIILLIGISGIYLILKDKQYSNSELFASFYEPYETIVNIRSGDSNVEELITTAFNSYQNKNYEEALVNFDLILKEDPANTFVMFYAAIAEIEINKVEEAIERFEFIIQDKNNLFIQQAEWYLGLCYLKLDKTEEAIHSFQKVISKEGYYSTKAEELVKKLSI